MLSFLHQALVQLFRNRTTLAVALIEQLLRVKPPRHTRTELREANLGEWVLNARRPEGQERPT
jgi:hypothetical protein